MAVDGAFRALHYEHLSPMQIILEIVSLGSSQGSRLTYLTKFRHYV